MLKEELSHSSVFNIFSLVLLFPRTMTFHILLYDRLSFVSNLYHAQYHVIYVFFLLYEFMAFIKSANL